MSRLSNRARRVRATASPRTRPWYGLVASPPPELAERLRRLQASLKLAEPVAEPQPEPHLTLKMPFELRSSLAEVDGQIAQVARCTAPIVVRLNGVGSFPGPYRSAIYADIAPNPRLQALHKALVRALEDVGEDVHSYAEEIELGNYVPHITIATDVSDDQLPQLLAGMREQQVQGSFRLTALELRRRDTDGRWHIVRSFPLTGPQKSARVARGKAPQGCRTPGARLP